SRPASCVEGAPRRLLDAGGTPPFLRRENGAGSKGGQRRSDAAHRRGTAGHRSDQETAAEPHQFPLPPASERGGRPRVLTPGTAFAILRWTSWRSIHEGLGVVDRSRRLEGGAEGPARVGSRSE